jgi:hypothetical protein
MPEDLPTDIDIDFVVDLILEYLEIHLEFNNEIRNDIVDGDLPFTERLEVIASDPTVREVVARRVAEAQAAGRAFPLPTAQDLAAARERQLARQRRRP